MPVNHSRTRDYYRAGLTRRGLLAATGAGAFAATVGGPIAGAAAAAPATVPSILSNGVFPIGMFRPPSLADTTDARYSEIAAAGFTFVTAGTGGCDVYNLAANQVLLPLCERHGLLAIVNDERVGHFGTTPSDQWPSLMRATLDDYLPYPAFAGLHMPDEPTTSLYPAYAGAVALGAQLAPDKLIDNNLVGYGGSGDYGTFLQAFIDQVHPSYFSFDRYMLLLADGYHNTAAQQAQVEGQYFTTLANAQHRSLTNAIPFWCYLQAVTHKSGSNYYRHPSYGDAIWQINTALAYGARGLQWFTYVSPGGTNYGDAVLTVAGAESDLYPALKHFHNDYLKPMGSQLLTLTPERTAHHGESTLPLDVVSFTPDGWITSVSGSPVIITRLRSATSGDRWMFVANRSYTTTATATLTVAATVTAVQEFSPSTRAYQPITLTPSDSGRTFSYSCTPGTARLYRLLA